MYRCPQLYIFSASKCGMVWQWVKDRESSQPVSAFRSLCRVTWGSRLSANALRFFIAGHGSDTCTTRKLYSKHIKFKLLFTDCSNGDFHTLVVVLGFNATLTARVISWQSVTHMCFLAFSHQYQHYFLSKATDYFSHML